jgi:two-component system sensor kinase FixL
MNDALNTATASELRLTASLQTLRASAIYVLLYVLADWLSYVQPILKLGITPWNPQDGLTLAFLLVYGPRQLYVTAIAAMLSEILIRQSWYGSPLVIGAAVWIAVGYGTLAAFLRYWYLTEPLRTVLDAARFAGAAIAATMVIAAGYVILFVATGELQEDQAFQMLPKLWIGDLTGILTVTPLLLYRGELREALRAMNRRRWEVLFQLAAIVATLCLIFGFSANDPPRFFYPLFVPVIWVGLRWGLGGAILAVLTIQIGFIIGSLDHTLPPNLLRVQFLMLTLSLTALFLGAVVTERTAVFRRAARQEAEQRAFLTTAPDAVIAVGPKGEARLVNPAARRLFGEHAKAPDVQQLLPGLRLAIPEGRVTLEGRNGDGADFPAEIAWASLYAPAHEGFIVTVRDASDRHQAEAALRERDEELARATRFAVAGQLASALAHELNQPIMALVSYLRVCEALTEPANADPEKMNVAVSKAVREAIRASEVLRRLRDFYRGGALKREAVNVGEVCSAVVMSFHDRLRNANTELSFEVDSRVPMVNACAIQLEIILHNLLSNALDAIGQSGRSTKQILMAVTQTAQRVVVRIEDSGDGLKADIAPRLFEPFLTSKLDGMGLGLVLSRSLARLHGGDLQFEPGMRLSGACFTLSLPLDTGQQA